MGRKKCSLSMRLMGECAAMVKRILDKKKALERELDQLWSKAVHKRWGERCAWPGCVHVGGILHAHHWIHKSAGKKARWCLENSILLDYFHHIHEIHQRGNTEPIREVLIERLGQAGFDRLRVDCLGIWKPSFEDLQELKKVLTTYL